MTIGQTMALLDAAMRSPHPLLFLDAVVTTFTAIRRHQDGTATAWMRCLYAQGEIELLMSLRSAWARGEDASLRETARAAVWRLRTTDNVLPKHRDAEL